MSTRTLAVIGTTAVLFSAVALPASAATTGDTPATTTVTGGSIAITAPTASVDLGAAVPGASTTSVDLGDVVVTDERAGIEGWIASATVTVLTSATVTTDGATYSAANAAKIPATAVAYTAPAATKTGTATVTEASPAASIATSKAVQTATAVSGNNTATWSPAIVINVPAQALAATDYAGTFTHSVA